MCNPIQAPARSGQISTDGGTEPVWSHNGRELYYRSGNKMMAVGITTQPDFAAGNPRMLFEGPYLLRRQHRGGPTMCLLTASGS